jgi:O-antigen chain-terminating methyltransferase
MFQQRRLTRLAETMAKESAPPNELAPIVRDQRLDSLYEAFEDEYRGSRADIKQRLVPYLDRLKLTGAGQSETPIVDIGCGRGEWLELLKDNGLTAYGIDVNSMMIERNASLGLDARIADLLEHLRSLDDASRSAITAFHVVEHLPFSVVIDFLDEALRVLRSGGMLILETPNPENMRVGATTFYNDPTHRNPIPPEPLRFIVQHRGFSDAEILRLHPAPAEERLKGKGWDIAHLNALLFGPRDYAILARRL